MGQTDLDLSQNSALTSLGPRAWYLTSPNLFCPICSEVNNVPLIGLVLRRKWGDILALGTSEQKLYSPCPLCDLVSYSDDWVAWSVLPAFHWSGLGFIFLSPQPPTCPGKVLEAPAPAKSQAVIIGLQSQCPQRKQEVKMSPKPPF